MEFGEFPLDVVEGAILAHSHRLPEGALKKGRRLSAADIDILRAAGYERLVCARLEAGDVLENDAANSLAEAALGANITKAAAFTGRCNLFAETDGLVVYDPQRLDDFNLVDEAITLGVVPAYQRVAKGQMIATLKIIPFGLPQTLVAIATSIATSSENLLKILQFRSLRAGLVQSLLPGTKQSVLQSTSEVTKARLRSMNCTLIDEVHCLHDQESMARGISEIMTQNVDLVLVSGASAVVDRRDVVPASVEAAGGRVLSFGMPVDPGNLMLMAEIENTPLVGMPGCARSPKLNGFDWILERIVAGVPANPRTIMRMGSGGLLKDVATRPLPRAKAQRGSSSDFEPDVELTQKPVARAPRIAALLLAAGQSRRMGRMNKLLAEIDGVAMVRRSAENLLKSKAYPVIVVTGYENSGIKRVLHGLGLDFVHNNDFADGLSTSLKIGIAALPEDTDGVLVCLGDMPRVGSKLIDKLIAAYDPMEGRAICVPTWHGKRGNPVLWDKALLPEISFVSGDVGARHLIGNHAEIVVEVEMDDDGVLIDVDTPDALAQLMGSGSGRKSG